MPPKGEPAAEDQTSSEIETTVQDSPTPPILPHGCERWPAKRQSRTRVHHNDATMERIGAFFGRRASTLWTVAEALALRDINPDEKEIALMGRYYQIEIDRESDYRRRDLITLLNNWNGELDRARTFHHQ